MDTKVSTFCTRCGRAIEGVSCPACPRLPRVSSILASISVAVAVATAAVTLPAVVGMRNEIRALRSDTPLTSGPSETVPVAEVREPAASHERIVALTREVRRSIYTVRTRTNSGTAFAASRLGRTTLLVTNFHVVEDAWRGSRRVVLRRRSETFRARVIRVSIAEDLALLESRADPDPLPLRRSAPSPGSTVVVIGSPLGLSGVISTGLVSGSYRGLIQLSAETSPGSSGSPVLDLDGYVIGVVSAKAVYTGSEGLSFAIPTRTVCAVMSRVCRRVES